MAARAAMCEAALLKAASEQHEALAEGALAPEGWEEADSSQCLGLSKCGWPCSHRCRLSRQPLVWSAHRQRNGASCGPS